MAFTCRVNNTASCENEKNLESEIKPQQNTDKRVDEKELKHNYKIEIMLF